MGVDAELFLSFGNGARDRAGSVPVGLEKRLYEGGVLIEGAEGAAAARQDEFLAVVDVADEGSLSGGGIHLHLNEGGVRCPDAVPGADGVQEGHDGGIVSGVEAEQGSGGRGSVVGNVAELVVDVVVRATHAESAVRETIRVVVDELVLELHGGDDLLVERFWQISRHWHFVAHVRGQAVKRIDGRGHAVDWQVVVGRELRHEWRERGSLPFFETGRLLRVRLVLGQLGTISRVRVPPLARSVYRVVIYHLRGRQIVGPRVHATHQRLRGLQRARHVRRTQGHRLRHEVHWQVASVLAAQVRSVDQMLIVTILRQLTRHARARERIVVIQVVLAMQARHVLKGRTTGHRALLNAQIATPRVLIRPAAINGQAVTMTDQD